jgi:protein TonB
MALSRDLPAFPAAAARSGNDSGHVVLSYDVTADGTVKDVRVLSAYPAQVFTRSAVSAVEKWRYLPGAADKRVVQFSFVRE